jgi:hypothetical protein
LIKRELVFEQQVDLVGAGKFDPETLERAFDEDMMRLQQMNAIVTDATVSFNWRGVWATATDYLSRDLLEGPDADWYYCTAEHLSGVFATDYAAGFWVLLLDRSSLLDSVTAAETAEENAEAAAIAAQLAQTAAESAAENIVAVWEDNPTSYDTGDLCAGSNGYTYRSIIDSNVGNDPTIDDGTNWVKLNGLPNIAVADEGKVLQVNSSGALALATLPIVDSLHAIGNAGTSETLDTVTYDTFTFTCDQSTLNLSATTLAIGRTITLVITGADNCTITWPTGVAWPGGSAPSFSSGVDRVVMQRISSTVIHASLAGAEYA